MTTIGEALKGDADLSPALKHGIDKLKSRAADGLPIPGEHHLSIYAQIGAPSTKKNGTQAIARNGDRILHTKDGRVVTQGNLFENMAAHIANYPDNQLLDKVTVIDRQTGDLIVQLRRVPTTGNWSRVYGGEQ